MSCSLLGDDCGHARVAKGRKERAASPAFEPEAPLTIEKRGRTQVTGKWPQFIIMAAHAVFIQAAIAAPPLPIMAEANTCPHGIGGLG